MIDKFQIQKLEELPIEGVAERLGLRVSHHKCLCPFHDDSHPSLTFDTRRNRYRCFVCGEYGRTIDLVMKMQNLRFPDACKWLADDSNVIISDYAPKTSDKPTVFDSSRYLRFFEHPWLNDAACRFLFEERGLNSAVIRWCRITSWCDKQGINWLQTPYYDEDGRLIGVQNRNLDYSRTDANVPRFRFPQGSRCVIYNLPVVRMLKPKEPLFITEGCSDCWAMLSAGHKAIAIPSATLLKPSDLKHLSALCSQLSTEFHMYPDQDEPGERLFLQLRGALPNLIRHQLPADCKDFGDYYKKVKGKEVKSITNT